MSELPKITVLMAVYNGQKYLGQAIESVLSQTFSNFEFFVINDASTDESLKIIQSYNDPRIKIINNDQNLGLTKSLNIGLRQALGKYVARQDADDISLPKRLEKQYKYLESNPEVVLIGSWAEVIDETGKIIGYKKKAIDPDVIKFDIIIANPILHSSIFFRREEILQSGGYNENYKFAQDFELYCRLIKKYKIINFPEILIQFRLHPQSIWGKDIENTKPETNFFALKIIYENISRYSAINNNNFKIFIDAINNKTTNLKNLIRSWQIYSNLFRSFVKKEKYTKIQIKKIIPNYKKRKKEFLKWYLKNRYSSIYNLLKGKTTFSKF